MKKMSILIFLFHFSCNPKRIEISVTYQNAFEHYLFLRCLRIDSSKVEFIMNNYIDSLKLDSAIFNQYVIQFDSDLKFRERILQKLVEKQDTVRINSNLKKLYKQSFKTQ